MITDNNSKIFIPYNPFEECSDKSTIINLVIDGKPIYLEFNIVYILSNAVINIKYMTSHNNILGIQSNGYVISN